MYSTARRHCICSVSPSCCLCCKRSWHYSTLLQSMRLLVVEKGSMHVGSLLFLKIDRSVGSCCFFGVARNQWTHATLNTMTSIGVAHEILFSEDYLSHPCSVEEDGQAAQTSAETGMCQNVWARLGNEIAKSRRSWQSHDGRKVADGGGGGGGGDESSSKPSGTSSHSEDEDVDFDHRVKWGRQYAHVYPGYNIAKWRRQFPEFAQIWEQHSVASASTTEHTGKRFTRQQKSSASSTLSSSDEKRRRHSRGNNKPNVVESASSPPSSSFQSASQASSTPLEPTKKKAEIYRRVLGNKNRQQRRR